MVYSATSNLCVVGFLDICLLLVNRPVTSEIRYEKQKATMITKEEKDKIIQKYGTKKGDTGSPQVQIALLTYEINDLSGHLKTHKKDFSSRRGLLKKVGQRRRLMRYLKKEDSSAYESTIKSLKLKDSV